MTTSAPSTRGSTYEPTGEQLARDRALKRFNRLYLYVPLGIAALIALGLVIALLVGVLLPGITGTAAFASALADIVLIMTLLPMLLLCAIVPGAYIALVYNQRQKRQQAPQAGPMAYRSRVQTLFWRLDKLIDTAVAKTTATAPQIAQPIVKLNSGLAFLSAFFNQLSQLFRRRK
jgi:hypothetical protein